jgi:hypothetical protein
MHITKVNPETQSQFTLVEHEVGGIFGFDLLQSKENPQIFALRYKGHITQELTKGKALRKGEEFRKAVDILRHFEVKAAA